MSECVAAVAKIAVARPTFGALCRLVNASRDVTDHARLQQNGRLSRNPPPTEYARKRFTFLPLGSRLAPRRPRKNTLRRWCGAAFTFSRTEKRSGKNDRFTSRPTAANFNFCQRRRKTRFSKRHA